MWRCKTGIEKVCNTIGDLKKFLDRVEDNIPLYDPIEIRVLENEKTKEKRYSLSEV